MKQLVGRPVLIGMRAFPLVSSASCADAVMKVSEEDVRRFSIAVIASASFSDSCKRMEVTVKIVGVPPVKV